MAIKFTQKDVLWEEVIPGGNHWSGLIRRGTALRMTDLSGGANCSALLYNADEKLERYNMPDSLKAQHTAFLTTGSVCYSDMGRVICSIIGDSLGWHDTICGVTDSAMITAKYGETSFQTHRNEMYRSGKDGLLIELAKHGLGKRDLTATVNFFSKVSASEAGDLSFVNNHSIAGSHVDIRFDMDVLLVVSTAPHPLDIKTTYTPADVKLSAWHVGNAGRDDVCRNNCLQNSRGFINTERYYL
ncbi:MAG: urea carboxylase-associated family protein [Bacteroidia bacterium]|nr:urea carboxylase-associated family protein [Methylotenera sp.]